MDPQDFGFLDQDPQKYADSRQGAKNQQKTAKKSFFTSKTQISTDEKISDYKNFLISEWFIKF